MTEKTELNPRTPLRLWPGVTFAIVLVLGRYVVPAVNESDVEVFSLPLGLIAIFAGIFGFIAVGPAALILFAVFFALFLWAVIRDRKPRPPR